MIKIEAGKQYKVINVGVDKVYHRFNEGQIVTAVEPFDKYTVGDVYTVAGISPDGKKVHQNILICDLAEITED